MTTTTDWCYLLGTISFVGIVVLHSWWKATNESMSYPPGPVKLPLIGSVHLLPQRYQERTLAEWGKTFGDIVFAKLFQTPAIIISSYDIARDLMERRSGNYSDRPRFILIVELMGWKNAITHLPYGEQFRLHRKWMQNAFQTKSALDGYRSIQRREVIVFLNNILSSPNTWASHLTRFSASIIMEITYGHQVTSSDDKFIGIAQRAGEETVTAGSPGSMLVDFFPIMKLIPAWCPGGGFKRKAAVAGKYVRELYDAPYNMVRDNMRKGTARPSFTANLIEQLDRDGRLTHEWEENVKGAAAAVYAAGTETTATVMMTFMLAMVRYPDVYRKLQEEINQVVGSERLPDCDDRQALPYTECVIKETYRWRTPVPLGIPHSSTKPDAYNDYHIPQNAMVIPNIWAMSQDERMYYNPTEFRPERFLKTNVLDPKNIVFGFGRRQCPGNELADRSIFLLISGIAATMDITKCKDSMGIEITPPPNFTSGLVSRPEEFCCTIKPRSGKAERLVRQMNVVVTEE
ncbi:hypothetical protein QCA50_019157 [Cerrena zonata]|uniref:Cytochrome P450 n=1 Tax=Cerrena zonata TaxID=2478898 RepID=A0AAW0FMA3_9APHY